MKTNIVIDISSPVLYLPKFWFLSYRSKCSRPIKLQNSLKCNISRKKLTMKFFCHADKHRRILQVDTIILGVSRQACPKYPKKEVCISSQYLQKVMGDEVTFLFVDKR